MNQQGSIRKRGKTYTAYWWAYDERENWELHDSRHTYATLALQAGVPTKVISERLGYASVSAEKISKLIRGA